MILKKKFQEYTYFFKKMCYTANEHGKDHLVCMPNQGKE